MTKPILLYSPIFDFTAENFTENLFNTDINEDSETWINTPGGSVFSGWSMVGALALRKQQTNRANNAIVMGDASSMGFYLLLFMDNVKAISASNFIVHRADAKITDDTSKIELISINNEIRSNLEKRVKESEFTRVTGVTYDELFSLEQRKNIHLTALQAKEIGLINEIIELEPAQIAAISTINFNQKKMSLKDKFFNKKPQTLAKSGETTISFRELEIGKEVEEIGSTEAFSGNFLHENKTVSVVDNKITAISESNEKDAKITELGKEVSALKVSAEENENAIVEIISESNTRIEALEKILIDAKLTKSTPKLPKGEFKEDKKEIKASSAKKRIKQHIQEFNKK